ncbi:MAG: hypothetical protein R3F43_18985 [bacterium]
MHPGSITALRSDAAGFYFAVARVGLFAARSRRPAPTSRRSTGPAR